MRQKPAIIGAVGLATAALTLSTAPAQAAAPAAAPRPAAAAAPRPAAAAAADPTVLLGGLTGAKAADVEASGNLVGAGIGPGGAPTLARYYTSGPRKGHLARLATLPDVPNDVAAGANGTIWMVFSPAPEEGPAPAGPAAGKLYRYTPGAAPSLSSVADIAAYAAAHPDPTNADGGPAGESNPYGLAALPNGGVLVADAAANSLLRVSASGSISTVARFPVQVISTAPATELGIPDLPPELPAEAVPTSVVVGPDGNYYVGELKGFPFTPGTSRVWKIRAGSTDLFPTATSSFARDGAAVHADGLTSIIDIAVGKGGASYALQFAEAGVLAVEAGDPAAPPPPAVLVKQVGTTRSEVGTGSIFLPGSVATNRSTGAVYVTDFQLAPGAGRLLRVE